MQYSRSPPPLQHPRPQHPPTQIPSTSPPPDAHSRGSTFAGTPDITTDYQRFSSPPVHAQQQQQHHFQSANPYGQSLPDSYVPSGLSGGSVPAYGIPQQQQPQQQSYYGTSPPNAPDASAGGGGVPWMNAMGAMGAMGNAASGGQWPGMNDATTQMGMQFGAQALGAGQAYIDKNVSRLLPLAHLKHSFDVSHGYVARKIGVVLWPWRHKSWARQVQRSEATGVGEGWKSPREDINCPDLYIPLMALCTYILMSSVSTRTASSKVPVKTGFDPSHLGNTASSAFGIVFLEFLCLKLGTYLLGIGEEGTVVDLVAYEGYKFVGVIVTLVAGLLGAKGWLFWATFIYVFLANFFFQLRSLRHLILPDPSMSPLDHASAPTSATISHAQRSRRIQFLFVVAAAQLPVMAILVLV